MNWQDELMKGAGALAAGAGLGYFKALREKEAIKSETDKYIPLLADLGVAALGMFGSMQMGGTIATVAAGITGGALGMAGAELYKQFTQPAPAPGGGSEGYQVPFSAPVSFPTFATGASVIEI
jgi:hypothetical protein